jgi:hypothetical protein
MRLRPHEDAIGQAVRDQFLGREAYELIEREERCAHPLAPARDQAAYA